MERRLTNPKTPLTLISIAALGAICFSLGSGFLLYHNTQNLTAAQAWIAHTDEVLLSVQRASQQSDRISDAVKYFLATKDPDALRDAQKDAIRLESTALHLKTLEQQNTQQDSNVQELSSCSANVLQLLSRQQDVEQVKPEILRCQQTLSLMSVQESDRLKAHTTDSQRVAQVSIASEAGILILSLSALGILFTILTRDVLIRTRTAREWVETNHALQNSHVELAETMRRLQERDHQSSLLSAYRDELQLCSTAQQVHRSAAVRYPQLLPGTNGALCITNSSRHSLEVVTTWGHAARLLSDVFPPEACCGLRAGHLRWRRPGDSEIDCTHFVGASPERYVCIPLVAQGEALGILFVECPTEEIMQHVETHSESLNQLVQLTAIAYASLELRSRLENQSIRDSLTNLFNRHFMQISLERELARATRRKTTLAVLMIDVDHFKSFNDRFSHAAGDAVLKEVAHVLQRTVRAEDVVCRYGGEEFTVILPEITEDNAMERATALRVAVEQLRTRIDHDQTMQVTISVGIALFPRHGTTPELLLRRADAALYRAKHAGRNRVFLASEIDTKAV